MGGGHNSNGGSNTYIVVYTVVYVWSYANAMMHLTNQKTICCLNANNSVIMYKLDWRVPFVGSPDPCSFFVKC